LWSESESDDVKKLIGVYLTQIKKDFATFGVRNPIVNTQKHYSICRDEIECDIDQFEEAVREFGNNQSIEKARTLVSLYKGEYLLDFEALWATAERIEYGSIYEQALDFLRKCSGSVPQSV
jgi:LuxR family maltose regulon positive regulatory protein